MFHAFVILEEIVNLCKMWRMEFQLGNNYANRTKYRSKIAINFVQQLASIQQSRILMFFEGVTLTTTITTTTTSNVIFEFMHLKFKLYYVFFSLFL